MDIDFDKIIDENLRNDIVDQFDKLLEDGKYDEAKQAVEDIVAILDAEVDIDISRGDNTADNSFHQLYIELTQKVTDRESSPAAAAIGNITDFPGLKSFLESATTTIFKTADVRRELIMKDPEMDEYRAALQDGIADAQARKAQLEKDKEKYAFIESEIMFDKSVTPNVDRRDTIQSAKSYADQLQEIVVGIDQIVGMQDWINDPSHSGPSYDAAKANYRAQIDTVKNDLKTKINDLSSQGLDVSTLGDVDDFVEDANLSNSKSNTEALRDARRAEMKTQYEAILQKIQDAKNGVITYTDRDGIVINIQNEEVFLNADISTIDLDADLDDGMSKIDAIMTSITDVTQNINNRLVICDQEVEIYGDHISSIDHELEQLAKDPNDRQAYIDAMDNSTKDAIQQEKDEKFQDAKDKFYGDRQKGKQYKQAWKRMKAHTRTVRETFVRADSTNIEFEYQVIDDTGYPEKNDDLKFMQLETWEERSRKRSLAKALCKGLKDPDKIADAIAEAYGDTKINKLEEELGDMIGSRGAYSAGSGRIATPEQIADMKNVIAEAKSRLSAQFVRDNDYVDNYNSSHFDVKDTVAIALTGGSAIRARSNQSKKSLTFGEGVAALFGLTSYAKKADGKRHILRTTIANAFGLISTPGRALKVAYGVVMGGATAAIGKLTGTYNMPTPYNVGYLDRREARLEYYRNHGSTRFGAWFKSLFNMNIKDENNNKIKLNDKLINDRCLQVGESIEDKYVRGAREKLLAEQEVAYSNLKARKAAYQNQARSAELYEDIYINDPAVIAGDTDEKNKIAKKAMQRGALSLGGKNIGPVTNIEDSFVTNGRKRQGKFVQNQRLFSTRGLDLNGINGGYDFSEQKGEAVWTNAISRENIQRAKTRGMDTAIRLTMFATLPLFKGILSKWGVKIFKKPDQIVPDQQITYDKQFSVTGHRPIIGPKTHTYVTSHQEIISPDNLTFGDLQRGAKAYWSADLDKYTGPHSAGIFSADATEISAGHFHFTDPQSGKVFDFSFSPKSYEKYVQSHGLNRFSTEYHDVVSFADSDNVIDSVIAHMPKETGEAYRRFIESASKAGKFKEAFESSTHFAYQAPTTATEAMGQGWSETLIGNAVKTVTDTRDVTVNTIIGWEDYPVTITRKVTETIKGYVKRGEYVEIPGGYIVGAAEMLSSDLKQALSPVFRRGQRNTQNFHDEYDDGRKKIGRGDTRDGNLHATYDMYSSPLAKSNNPDEPGDPYLYESAKYRKDRALNATKNNGDPIIKKDSNGNPKTRDFDDDDFVL